MAKKKEKADAEETEPRIVLRATEEQRRRFRAYCIVHGQQMQELGLRWIMDRLEQEERKGK